MSEISSAVQDMQAVRSQGSVTAKSLDGAIEDLQVAEAMRRLREIYGDMDSFNEAMDKAKMQLLEQIAELAAQAIRPYGLTGLPVDQFQ